MFAQVTRRRYLAGTHTAGRWVSGGYADSTIIASVQPVKSSELLLLPEGERTRGSVKVYSDDDLRTADEPNKLPADRILWDGYEWEVFWVDDHQLGIAHSKAICLRIDQ